VLQSLPNMGLVPEHFCEFGVLCMMRKDALNGNQTLEAVLTNMQAAVNFRHTSTRNHAP
jgi:hypothetical protein